MKLKEYKKKRKFNKTPEPGPSVKKDKGNTYVIQKHDASHLHWDLRLEMEGVLKSWAVPKKPPQKAGIRRLAIQTEDHPISYADFEGEIPKGRYGAGKVEIWDKGNYKILEKKKDKIEFKIMGKKLQGIYLLIKFKGKDKWLFFEKKSNNKKK